MKQWFRLMVDNHRQGDRDINRDSQSMVQQHQLQHCSPKWQTLFRHVLPPLYHSFSDCFFFFLYLPNGTANKLKCQNWSTIGVTGCCSGQCQNEHKKSNIQWNECEKGSRGGLHYLSDWYRFMASIIIRHNKAGNWIGMLLLLLPCTAFSD